MRILLISPPHAEAAYLHKAFQESAHSLQRADDCRDGAFLASLESFDAIVVVAIEPWSYQALLEELPQFSTALNTPALIVILGPATAVERAKVLRAGADACFGQPYSLIELHERMQALQRTAMSSSTGERARPSFQLDALRRELVEGDRRLAVTKREYLLLECLMRDLNAPVPRDQLIRYAWPEKEDVDPSSVNLVVARLRRKLVQHFPEIRIETVSRYGYQLTASR
jgi:two-component system, OmpR family, response regulator